MFEIIRTIGAVTRTIQLDSNQQFKPLHLNNNLFIYIIRVVENPGMFLAELADHLQIDRATSFRTVQNLVKMDYLSLEDDPENRKIKRVFPTQKARELYPTLHDYEQLQSDQLLKNLTEQEQQTLTALLKKLHY
jgi:DNA-binding MarR family transcriptional regulator